MKQLVKQFFFFLFSSVIAVGLIHYLALPTLMNYPRLARMIDRFTYTEETLTLFLFFSIWLFLIQWQYGKFSTIYIYLVYTVYLFLLFVVLFAKAERYRSYSFDPFDFLIWNRRILIEAFLNVVYFIPLGGLYGLKAKLWEFLILSLLTILGVETIQYVFYVGTFAVSDILLNFIGCVVGYLFIRLLVSNKIKKSGYLRRVRF